MLPLGERKPGRIRFAAAPDGGSEAAAQQRRARRAGARTGAGYFRRRLVQNSH
jgi:hypothetical protein